MRRVHLILLALVSSGCATATEPPNPYVVDSGKTGEPDGWTIPEDTRVAEEDTRVVEEDTGSTKVDSGTPSDSSSPVDTGADSTATDSSVTDSSVTDTELPDTAIPPDTSVADTTPTDGGVAPTRILAGSSLVLHGVTTDNYAIVSDATGSTSAVPLAGGAPVAIATGTSTATVSGHVVFSWGATDSGGFAPLRVWSAATGMKSVATKALVPTSVPSAYVASASKDGTYIFFTDNALYGTVSDKADIKVARTDGTGVRTVFTQYFVYDGTSSGLGEYCAPYAGWVGTRFVTSHCTPSGSIASFDVSSIDPATGSATSLGTNLDAYWTADDAGAKVALVASGSLRVVPVAGGVATTIDSSVASGMFTHDGASIIYRTTGNVLRRSSVTSPSPLTLTSGATAILSNPSPDDKWVLYAGTGTSGAYDVRRASTTTAGSTTLHSGANADVYGSGFTADSAYAIYYTNVTSLLVGNLVAYPMAGGAPITLGANAWIDLAVGGSKLVYNDDHSGTSTSGTATIRARDVGGVATTIATGANRNFTMNGARDTVVYLKTDGLYAAPIL